MASPVSPGEVIALAKFAYRLWKSCKAAKGEFDNIAMEVSTTNTLVQLVHCDLEDPESIMNLVDNKEKTIRKQLGIHIRNCKNALTDVENLLERYNNMSVLDKAAWILWGHTEVAGLKANLSSFTTQLDSWIARLTLKAVGLVNRNVVSGIGRIEQELEKNNGNDRAAVAEIMRDMKKSGASHERSNRYSAIISSYAKEVSSSESFKKTQRARTPDPPRGRHDTNTLEVPKGHNRAQSADTLKPGNGSTGRRRASIGDPAQKKPKYRLECWLIQIKSGQALFVTFQLSEKEQQIRGQWKLEEMASQFKSSRTPHTLEDDHDLVQWVVKDRKKHEHDNDYTWCPHAAKIERKGSLSLGLGVEEQAMVIIKRQRTAKAQLKFDEEQAIAAAKRKAEQEKAQKEKLQREAAKRKKDEAAAEAKKKEREKRKKDEAKAKAKKEEKEKRNKLEEENTKLKAAVEKLEKEKQSNLGPNTAQESRQGEVNVQTEKRSKSKEPKLKKEADAEKPAKKENQPRPEQGKAQELERVKANGKGQRVIPDITNAKSENSERSNGAGAGKKPTNKKDDRNPMKDKDVNKM